MNSNPTNPKFNVDILLDLFNTRLACGSSSSIIMEEARRRSAPPKATATTTTTTTRRKSSHPKKSTTTLGDKENYNPKTSTTTTTASNKKKKKNMYDTLTEMQKKMEENTVLMNTIQGITTTTPTATRAPTPEVDPMDISRRIQKKRIQKRQHKINQTLLEMEKKLKENTIMMHTIHSPTTTTTTTNANHTAKRNATTTCEKKYHYQYEHHHIPQQIQVDLNGSHSTDSSNNNSSNNNQNNSRRKQKKRVRFNEKHNTYNVDYKYSNTNTNSNNSKEVCWYTSNDYHNFKVSNWETIVKLNFPTTTPHVVDDPTMLPPPNDQINGKNNTNNNDMSLLLDEHDEYCLRGLEKMITKVRQSCGKEQANYNGTNYSDMIPSSRKLYTQIILNMYKQNHKNKSNNQENDDDVIIANIASAYSDKDRSLAKHRAIQDERIAYEYYNQ